MASVETRWWWVRHAPVRNYNGRIYGQLDLPADCSDKNIFSALATKLPRHAILTTSDLKRTTQTALGIVKAGLELPETIAEPAFREQCFGDWQGMKYIEYERMRRRRKHKHWLSPAYERPPAGESFADVIERVVPAINRINATYSNRDIVAIAHGGTIRAAIASALNLNPETALAFKVDNLSVTRLDYLVNREYGATWRIVYVNQPTECEKS